MNQSIKNIYRLGVKELLGLCKDIFLLILIVYCFTLQMYDSASAATDSVHNAAIAIVDEDHSQLTARMAGALLPPYFLPPRLVDRSQIEKLLDDGDVTFVVVFPHNFERDVVAGRSPRVQLNVDATRMTQAFTGSGYVEKIFRMEAEQFLGKGKKQKDLVNVITRNKYNENLTASWLTVLMQLVSNVTLLAIILTGSALIRERERGTLEHLMVLPVTPFQIMFSKVWSMAVIVLVSSGLSLFFVIHKSIGIPMNGSFWVFMLGMAVHIFAVTCLGIFLACMADSMPQLGMLMILVLMPMQMLSGGLTPYESMPEFLQKVMMIAPTTHITLIAQKVLFRGATLRLVMGDIFWLFGIGAVLFIISLRRFRKSL